MAVTLHLDRDPLARLERRWRGATVAVARAQARYQELQHAADADEKTEARAWLRLWKAERRQRTILIAMDGLID
jgi:hypothetical protein